MSFVEALKTEAKHIEDALAAAVQREKAAVGPVVKAEATQARKQLETRKADLKTALADAGVQVEKTVVSDVKADVAKDVAAAETAVTK